MGKEQQTKHEVAIQNQKDKLKERKKTIKDRDARIAELEEMLRAKNEDLELMDEKLKDSQSMHKENKKYRAKISDLEDEIAQFEYLRQQEKKALDEANLRAKNFKKQLKMLEKMPGN